VVSPLLKDISDYEAKIRDFVGEEKA